MARASVPSRRPDRRDLRACSSSACGGSTIDHAARAQRGGAVDRAVDARAEPRRESARRPSRPAGRSTIRWFCCLGGGDDPSQQKAFEARSSPTSTRPPEHQARLRLTCLRAGPATRFATEIASGNRPGHRRPASASAARTPSRASGSTSPRSSRRTTTTCPASARSVVDFYKVGRPGPGRHPVRDLPVRALLPAGHVRRDRPQVRRPHKYGDAVQDARRLEVDWNYDTIRQIAMQLTVDKNGKDATAGRRSTRRRSSSTASSRSATTCGAGRLLRRRPASSGTTARPSRSRTPGRPAWKWCLPGRSGPTTSS